MHRDTLIDDTQDDIMNLNVYAGVEDTTDLTAVDNSYTLCNENSAEPNVGTFYVYTCPDPGVRAKYVYIQDPTSVQEIDIKVRDEIGTVFFGL